MTLAERLERLTERTQPRDPAEVLADARARAGTARHGRRRSRALLAAAALVVLGVAVGGLAVVAGHDRDPVTVTGPDDGTAAVRVLPGWVPDGYQLAWVDLRQDIPPELEGVPMSERPPDHYAYAYGYQDDASELEVRFRPGATLDQPYDYLDGWHLPLTPMSLEGRPALGHTGEHGGPQLLLEVDGGVAIVMTYAAETSQLPSWDDVEQFAGSLAVVDDARWAEVLGSSGADVASTFGPRDGEVVIDGDGWSINHGQFRAPRAKPHGTVWIDWSDLTHAIADDDAAEMDGGVNFDRHGDTHVVWGVLPADGARVEVTIEGQVFDSTAVETASGSKVFAVEVPASTTATFRAFDNTGSQLFGSSAEVVGDLSDPTAG